MAARRSSGNYRPHGSREEAAEKGQAVRTSASVRRSYILTTTYQETLAHFAGRSRSAAALLASWKADPHHADVVPFVEAHKTSALYRLTSEDVQETCQSTDHALGEVKRAVAESVISIRDWHAPFAFVHDIHYAMELLGKFPTYQEFRELCDKDNFLLEALLQPSRQAVKEAISLGASRQDAKDAMRWRVGNAYYSALREVYTLVTLRELGVDLRYHVLADALFAVDAWCGDVALSLYVQNSRYRTSSSGRKNPAERLLADAVPPIHAVTIQLKPAERYGVVHLPTREEIAQAARSLARA